MKYLISATIQPFYDDGSFIEFFKAGNCKKVLVICEHNTQGPDASFERLMTQAKGLTESDIEFHKGDKKFLKELKGNFDAYDGLNITGGWTAELIDLIDELGIRSQLVEFILDPSKVYVGSSAGALIIGSKFNTESELEYLDKAKFVDKGLAIFEDVLIEVHYKEGGNEDYLNKRISDTLAKNLDIKFVWALESDCCLAFEDFSKPEFVVEKGIIHLLENTKA